MRQLRQDKTGYIVIDIVVECKRKKEQNGERFVISILPRLSNTHSWGRYAADLYATPTETFDKFGGKFWREILAGDFGGRFLAGDL